MPTKIEQIITRGYERKGYSPKRAKGIAIATMIKKHLWHLRKGKGRHR